MYNVFPVTRKSLDPVGTAQSTDGVKRALGSLLNVFNGTVALPTHWHLRDEIIVAGTDIGRMGGGVIEHLPAPAIPRSLLLLGKHCDCLSRVLASHYLSNRRDCAQAVAGTGEVMCSAGGDAGQKPSAKVAAPNIVAT